MTDEALQYLRRCVELASEALDRRQHDRPARTQNLDGNLDAIAEVTSWRLPDVVFDERTEVDLGGRTVQLWHFGPGNSPGETVVWVAEARAAWTGNLLGHRRVVPMLLEAVTRARRLGLSALATVETVPLPRGYGFPRWHPAARMNWLVHDLHRLNALATYRDLERQPTAA